MSAQAKAVVTVKGTMLELGVLKGNKVALLKLWMKKGRKARRLKIANGQPYYSSEGYMPDQLKVVYYDAAVLPVN